MIRKLLSLRKLNKEKIMEECNGKKRPNLFIKDELDEICKIYGDNLESLWKSLIPKMNSDFGKFIVFGTSNTDYSKEIEDYLKNCRI